MNFFNFPYKNLFPVLALSVLFACGSNDTTQEGKDPTRSLTKVAVIATGAADYSSGAHSVLDYTKPRSATNDLLPTISDLKIASYGRYFYRMERFGYNNITKFSIDDPSTPIWQFSTEGIETNSNPNSIIFASSTKAYLIRYGSPIVWIINPAATTEANFKIGELDLSDYSNCDGFPEATDGVIVNNKLFISLQRLCSWDPTDPAYVAVFDTNSDTEINTGMGEIGLLGIKLDVRNPGGTYGKIKYHNGYVYVPGADGLYGNENTPVMGGIQRINTNTYQKSSVLGSSRQITSLEIISDTKGYFAQCNDAFSNKYTLVSFNPQTWTITNEDIADTTDRDIRDIKKDDNGMLWLADASMSAPGIYIIDPATDTIQEGPISTNLNPLEITFCEK